MEIKKIYPETSPILHNGKAEVNRSGGGRFLALLEASTAKLNKTGPPGTDLLSGPISSVLPLGDSWEGEEGILATEKTLGILEAYQRALSNSEVPLKRMEPLIQFLSQDLDRLVSLSERLPSSHPLKNILTDAGILSAVEIERFYRGDYSE